MWLLDAQSRKLRHFADVKQLYWSYAILSHTWGEDEVIFTDMENLAMAEGRDGFKKISYTCEQALRDGISYVWVDTCCIDKRSSAELTESINSMFDYYRQAQKCYVYLQDVPGDCPPLKDGKSSQNWLSTFSNSRWFQRGWTLQELLASHNVEFYNADWGRLGSLNDVIASVAHQTQIDTAVLLKVRRLEEVSIAQRMSWAACRQTSRVEDRAYSLLGIFAVNMALIYGEGENAFKRLQEAILRKTTDQSLLAWGYDTRWGLGMPLGLFADSPEDFQNCHNIVPGGLHNAREDVMELTSVGMHINLHVIRAQDFYLGVLNARFQDNPELYLALYLEHSEDSAQQDHVFRVSDTSLAGQEHPWRLYVVDISQARQRVFKTRALLMHNDIRINFGLTREQLPLWIQIDSACSLEIIDAFPAEQWNFVSGTMTPGYTGGLEPEIGGRQNFTAVALRDRNAHHRRKVLCFGIADRIPATVATGSIENSIIWCGFMDESTAEEACSKLKTELRESLRGHGRLREGVKLWGSGDSAIRLEERGKLGMYSVFGLRPEETGNLLLQTHEVPLLLRFQYNRPAAGDGSISSH